MKGAKFEELCIHCCDFSRFVILEPSLFLIVDHAWRCVPQSNSMMFILWYVFKKIMNGGQHFEHGKIGISCITFSKKLNEEKPHKF